jgi:uridine kinase
MSNRERILNIVGSHILQVRLNHAVRVAVDGVDGAGKTTFADELKDVLGRSGRPIIRASVDNFHNSEAVRYRCGRNSPQGFFHDSYDYCALKTALLDPLSLGGSGRYRLATFDLSSDTPISGAEQEALSDSILILDGIFLHRSDLVDYWDVSVFLDVPFEISVPRGNRRYVGHSLDPTAVENSRYVEGQKIYLSSCEPRTHATFTIDNSDLSAPLILST